MIRFILPVLFAACAAAPALAEAPASAVHFTRDGTEYVATVSDRDGVQTISGREVDTGRRFTLRIVDGRVSGRYDGHSVSYAVPEARAQADTGAQLSAR